MRRAPAKAYQITWKKQILTVSPATYEKLSRYHSRTYYPAFSKLRYSGKLSVEPIKGNKSFELSPASQLAVLLAMCKRESPALLAKERAEAKISEKKYQAEKKQKAAQERLATLALVKSFPLPSTLEASDLFKASKKDELSYEAQREAVAGAGDRAWSGDLEMWHAQEFGWCFPNLLIKSGSRRGTTDRTYATRASDGALVRIGFGPHIQARVMVHLKKSNLKRLAPLLEILRKGAQASNNYRDLLSTRRAQRSFFRRW